MGAAIFTITITLLIISITTALLTYSLQYICKREEKYLDELIQALNDASYQLRDISWNLERLRLDLAKKIEKEKE